MATLRPPVFSRPPPALLPPGVISQPLGVSQILAGKDKFFGAAGQPPANMDWPLPQRRPVMVYYDLPTPNVLASLLSVVAPSPFHLSDWPVPQAQRYPTSNLTHLDSLKINLLGKDLFFSVAGRAPTYDWPNPRRPQYASSLWVFSDPLKLNLLGKDKFFSAAGIGPDYDWPNPRGPQYAPSLRVFSDPLKLNLLGKDRFFSAAGQPPANMDWPVPRGQPPIVHYQWPTPNVLAGLLSVIQPMPFNLVDWPNPVRARDAAGVALRAWNDTWQNNVTVRIRVDTPGDITDTDIVQKPVNVVIAGDMPIKGVYWQNDVRPMNVKVTRTPMFRLKD